MKEYIPFFASVVLLAIYLVFKLIELEWFWGCILLASIVIYTLISNTKLTKEKLESRICDYLYDNDIEYKKKEEEIYFTCASFKCFIDVYNRYTIFFLISIRSNEHTQFTRLGTYILDNINNTGYRSVTLTPKKDSCKIEIRLRIENNKTYKERFPSTINLVRQVLKECEQQIY
ncbi:hypothetical protein [Butyricimonas virosa]|uniref:hypothetical protein n=1 Tax=Butyricimonas virosa TaxID=544645 RepID=UPI0022DFCF61|nr:hypothetical protein [Butyricimonas virosa]